MKRIFVVGLALALAGACLAQSPGISRRAAWSILTRHTVALSKVIKGVTVPPVVGDATPLSRSELINEMGRIFDQAKPQFRWTPVYYRHVDDVIAHSNPDTAVQANLKKLVRYSCIGPVGPLVVGPSNTLTAEQFGDALAFFYLRITQLCHQPDPKWTPDLQNTKDSG